MQINLNVKSVLVFIWIIFSLWYICWDLYWDLKNNVMKNGFVQWQTKIMEDIFAEVQRVGCEKPVTLNYVNQKVDLVNLTCISQWQGQSQPQVGTWTTSK